MEPKSAAPIMPLGNLAFPSHIAAMHGSKIKAPVVPTVTLQRYLRLWIYAWQEGPMEVVKGFPDNNRARMVAALLGEAEKQLGFGVLIDRTDGSVEYFLTRQVSLPEAQRCFRRYQAKRTRDNRKPIDRTYWDEYGKPHIRKHVSSGHFDHFYKHGL